LQESRDFKCSISIFHLQLISLQHSVDESFVPLNDVNQVPDIIFFEMRARHSSQVFLIHPLAVISALVLPIMSQIVCFKARCSPPGDAKTKSNKILPYSEPGKYFRLKRTPRTLISSAWKTLLSLLASFELLMYRSTVRDGLRQCDNVSRDAK
jgi:hypothetical protein